MGAVSSAVKSGDALRLLKAQRARLATEIDLIAPGMNPGAVATLSRQLVAVCDKIAAMEKNSTAGRGGSVFDDLAEFRKRKQRKHSQCA